MLRVPRICLFAVTLAGLMWSHGVAQFKPSATRNRLPDAARAIVESADQIEILPLEPALIRQPAKGDFYGYRVLGKKAITNPAIRKRLVSALEKGIEENQGEIAACFNPRHGIHATRNGKFQDLVICFECRQVELYGQVENRALVSHSPQHVFDEVLRDAGIQVADK